MEAEQTQQIDERYRRRTAWVVRRLSWSIIVLALLSFVYHPSDGWVRPLLTILSASSALLAFSEQSDAIKRWTRFIGTAIMGVSFLSAFAALLNDPNLSSIIDFLSNMSDVVRQAPVFLVMAFAHSVYVNYFLIFTIGLISFGGTPKLKKAKRDALTQDIEAAKRELRRVAPQIISKFSHLAKSTATILIQIAVLPFAVIWFVMEASVRRLKALWPKITVVGIAILIGLLLLIALM